MANDPASHVDRGFLQTILASGNNATALNSEPILQCVQIKNLQGQTGGPERYRVVLSDINNFIQTMLATQASHVVHEGKLTRGCFVRLKKYNVNAIKGKMILIVLDLEVVEELGQCDKIGEPKTLEQVAEEDSKPAPISANGFYGNRQETGAGKSENHQQQGQRLPSRPGGRGSSFHGALYPIESLSPYGHKWTIKARVTSKSDVKTWHNKNGEGRLFSVNLLDESGEIKATGFGDQCDAFFDVFQEGFVYYISSPCRVQLAKKQYSNLNNDYELTFERDTLVEKAEEQSDVPQMRFNFTSLSNLQNTEKDAIVDTIGILREASETTQIVSKNAGKPFDKRELTMVDNSGFAVRLTIWGTTASSFDARPESVIAFKGVKVSDFGGRSLSLLSSGTMSVDPDIDEAHMLKGWYEAQGRHDTFATHSGLATTGPATGRTDQLKTISQVKEEKLGLSEQPDYFTAKATLIFIKQDSVAYPACLSEGCNKKVVEDEPDVWRCEKCSKTFPKPEYRYVLRFNVIDHTGSMYLSCFDEVGRLIMGMPADQLMQMKEDQTDKEVFQEATCQTFAFRCRAKMEIYQDEPRVKYQVLSATPLNFSTESAKLQSLIKMYD